MIFTPRFFEPKDLIIERLNRDIRIKLHLDLVYTIEENKEWTNESAAQKIIYGNDTDPEDENSYIIYSSDEDTIPEDEGSHIIYSSDADAFEININLVDLSDDIMLR